MRGRFSQWNHFFERRLDLWASAKHEPRGPETGRTDPSPVPCRSLLRRFFLFFADGLVRNRNFRLSASPSCPSRPASPPLAPIPSRAFLFRRRLSLFRDPCGSEPWECPGLIIPTKCDFRTYRSEFLPADRTREKPCPDVTYNSQPFQCYHGT